MHASLAGGTWTWEDLSRSTGSNLVLDGDSDIATTLRAGTSNKILDVFFRASNQLWSIERTAGGSWTGMYHIDTAGNPITRGPAAVSNSSSRIDVFFGYLAGSTQGHVGNITWNGSGWTGVAPIPGDILAGTGPAVASNGPGNYDLVYTGTDSQVYTDSLRSGSWQPVQYLGTTSDGSAGGSARNPGVDPTGREDFLVREPTGGLRLTTWRNGSFSGLSPVSGSIQTQTGPAAYWSKATDGADRLDIATYRGDQPGAVQQRTYRDDSGWTAWTNLPFDPTSWTYGGTNLTIDPSTSEPGDVVTAIRNASSDANGLALYGGLTDTDKTTVDSEMRTHLTTGSLYRDFSPGGKTWFYDGTKLYEVPDANTAAEYGLNLSTALRVSPGAVAPVTRAPALVPVFANGARCSNGSLHAGSLFGLAMGRDATLVLNSQLHQFDMVIGCLRALNGGAAPTLRLQVPIDAMRRANTSALTGGPGTLAGGPNQIADFKTLLARIGPSVQGVVSITSPSFAICSSGASAADPGAGAPLSSCNYPTQTAYRQMFQEIVNAVNLPNVVYTAWNEPDITNFQLRYGDLPSTAGYPGFDTSARGARLGGRFWAQAASIVGAGRVLAGEFGGSDTGLVSNFNAGIADATLPAGVTRPSPQTWALHEYSQSTLPAANAFAGVVGNPLWLTEVGAKTSAITTDSAALNYGQQLRARAVSATVNAFMYYLQDDGTAFDSALLDSSGRARKVLCGLGNVANAANCTGTWRPAS